jgi:hypothetical protein
MIRLGLRQGSAEVRQAETGAKQAAQKSEDRNPKPEGRPKCEIRAVIAKAGNSREKAQKVPEKAPFPYLLRLLRLFAAVSAMGFRALDKLG